MIEAVFENLELKKHVFRELDAVAKPGAVLATNTSTLDIDEIAGCHEPAAGRRRPALLQPRARHAAARGGAGQRRPAPEVLATALALAKRLGKVPVVVGNCRGFVGNRMMFPYMYEAQFLVEEGATPEQVDRALTEFGMAMGIFAVDDMAGIDVAWRVRQELGHFQRARRTPAARGRQALRARTVRAEDRPRLVPLRRAAQGRLPIPRSST